MSQFIFSRISSLSQTQKILLGLYFFFLLNGNPTKYTQANTLRNTRLERDKSIDDEAKSLSSCGTSSCVKAAIQILSYLNERVDPCDNFYQFASGNYLNSDTVPDDRESTDLYETVTDLTLQQLQTILNEPQKINDSKQFRLVKNYHMACLNETIIEKRGVEPLLDILNELGGWPVLEGSSWSENDWDWIEVIKKFRNIGLETDAIFSLSVESNLRNSTHRILEVIRFSISM